MALARPVRAAPVQPTTATIGVTPVVAKTLNLSRKPTWRLRLARLPRVRRRKPTPACRS
jgi:hypothetical protein